jgi:hypothetical protein
MTKICARAALLSIVLLTAPISAFAATPPPSPHPRATMPTIRFPNVPLHAEYLVEVNKFGQVVRVKSSKPTKDSTFNVQSYGNAMQMWIRKSDGSATVGLFKVSYDYDPKTRKVTRNVALVSTGGSWVNDEQKRHDVQSSSLPSLNQITGKSPTPSPTP